jgi:hypothetical protein
MRANELATDSFMACAQRREATLLSEFMAERYKSVVLLKQFGFWRATETVHDTEVKQMFFSCITYRRLVEELLEEVVLVGITHGDPRRLTENVSLPDERAAKAYFYGAYAVSLLRGCRVGGCQGLNSHLVVRLTLW